MRERKRGMWLETNERGFLICSICGHKTNIKVLPNTVLRQFPLYCNRCKVAVTIDYPNSKKENARA